MHLDCVLELEACSKEGHVAIAMRNYDLLSVIGDIGQL